MFLKYNIWGILWVLLILVACSTPGEQLPPAPFFNFDKLVHFFFYGMLQFLFLRGFLLQHQWKWLRKHYIATSMVVSSLYGIWIELMQGYAWRNRSLDINDMVANVVGVILATIIWAFVFRKKMEKKATGHS